MRPSRAPSAWAIGPLVIAATLGMPMGSMWSAPAWAQYGPVSPWDASIREIRSAASYSNDGTHHALLVSLRELHDPALKPFFQSLVQGDHWSIQIDGILGLAELSPDQRVDPFLLSQLKGEEDRSTAIAAAIGLGLVGLEQASAILAWDDLPPRDRVLVSAELVARGGKPDAASLAKLAEHRNDEVAGLAAFVLAAVTNEAKPVDAFRSRFAALPAKERATIFVALASAISRFKLASGANFLIETLKDTSLPSEARTAGLASLLPLAPEAGYAAWRSAVQADSSQANRVRLALLLLASDTTLPAGAAAPLRSAATGQDPLLARLADAIDALAAGGDASSAFRALVATKHRPSLAVALQASKRLVPTARVAVLNAFADLLERDQRADLPPAAVELCLEAMARLALEDLAEIARRLRAVQEARVRDDILEEFLFVALLAANTKEAAAIADAARGNTTRRGASLATVLKARHSESLDDESLRDLGVVASGGGRVERPLQVQAAWLYAKLSGKADQAIAAALSP